MFKRDAGVFSFHLGNECAVLGITLSCEWLLILQPLYDLLLLPLQPLALLFQLPLYPPVLSHSLNGPPLQLLFKLCFLFFKLWNLLSESIVLAGHPFQGFAGLVYSLLEIVHCFWLVLVLSESSSFLLLLSWEHLHEFLLLFLRFFSLKL